MTCILNNKSVFKIAKFEMHPAYAFVSQPFKVEHMPGQVLTAEFLDVINKTKISLEPSFTASNNVSVSPHQALTEDWFLISFGIPSTSSGTLILSLMLDGVEILKGLFTTQSVVGYVPDLFIGLSKYEHIGWKRWYEPINQYPMPGMEMPGRWLFVTNLKAAEEEPQYNWEKLFILKEK